MLSKLSGCESRRGAPAAAKSVSRARLAGRYSQRQRCAFASNGIHGLNCLNAWWLQLGIVHQLITPASPQENGAHERMHRVLKAQATKPAAANANLQHVDPTLSVAYRSTHVPWPHRSTEGQQRRHLPPTQWATIPESSAHDEMIGLEEVQDGIRNVLYYETLLGRFDEGTRTTGAPSLKKDC